jgi:hypothetical protein
MDETSEQRISVIQDTPSFCSSVIHDQDSSDDMASPQEEGLPESQFKHDEGIVLPGPPPTTSRMIVPAPMKVNLTSTLGAPKLDAKPMFKKIERPFENIRTACCSRLFWWIVLLMVS